MKMPWTHVDRKIAEYCDGRLSAREVGRIDAHLECCQACRTAVDDFRFAAGLLTRLSPAKAPDSLWPSIETALAIRATEQRGTFFFARRVALAAMVVLAIGAPIYWYSARH